ncbi:MAG TPA: sigma-70 family RNA polymerase sigma factor [Chitinophagaceae bacterium]|nr:sigma-70 family RNA polymerase sigma factor [Chitinophagaceae bacterium]
MKMANEDTMEQLYRDSFPAAARLLQRMGATLEDARDAFHDALLIYLEKTRQGSVTIRTSPKAYIVGTARIIWLHTRKDVDANQDIDSLLPQEVADYLADEASCEESKEKAVVGYLRMAGQKCMEILKAFYYLNLPLSQIATRFGFNGTRSATVQKYKCIEKIRSQLKTNNYHAERVV